MKMKMVLMVELMEMMIPLRPDVMAMTMATISPSGREVSPAGICLPECFLLSVSFPPRDGGGKIMQSRPAQIRSDEKYRPKCIGRRATRAPRKCQARPKVGPHLGPACPPGSPPEVHLLAPGVILPERILVIFCDFSERWKLGISSVLFPPVSWLRCFPLLIVKHAK